MPEGTFDFDMDLARVRAVTDYQFGKGAADALLDGQVEIKEVGDHWQDPERPGGRGAHPVHAGQ